ncbi:DNA/RNA non-specific endonuclease [Agrobacterium cavarae]|uniref:DNA/RNA non-specific endonuclease n=1 Tax=Agrobacterium cavarae TaxID=2528239 RepID=UPI00289E2067|nr:DNA/RNA non-specific endonuclease [Agrobacterium cavarae]
MKIGAIDLNRWASDAPAVSTRALVNSIGSTALAREAIQNPMRMRLRNLAADGQKPTAIEMEAAINDVDLVDANFIERCRLVMNSIGRLQVDTSKGRAQATGFLIAPGLLMTNHHVLPDEIVPAGGRVQFGYWHDVAGGENPTVTFTLEPHIFFVADQELDFAVVAVSATSTNGIALSQQGYLKLNPATGKIYEDRFVTIVQYPDGDYMQIALRENRVIRASQDEYAIRYTADTAHGSSGAPVFNDGFQVAALHSGGRIKRNPQGEYLLKNGTWVADVEDRRESDVVWEFNVGIRVSRICPLLLDLAGRKSPAHRTVLEAAMAGGDILSDAIASKNGGGNPIANVQEVKMNTSNPTNPSASTTSTDGSLIVPIALRISLVGAGVSADIETPEGKASDLTVDSQEAFRFRIPIIYDDLEARGGFQREFLNPGDAAPMPVLTDMGERVAAPLLDGSGVELKYHKFSIWMHATRRLALFTASNVDFRDRQKTIDGKGLDRKTLAGFPKTGVILEQWVEDPRIDKRHQLADVFYSDDRGAFDKGHLVRRDDVCWGKTFEDIQMSNGDTYHVTNCSPQISTLNQGTDGEANWGDLEGLIQKATKADQEAVIIYSGPVFGASDRWFHGKDDAGSARIQIPSEFWKIVVSRDDQGYGAYGFTLSQDVQALTEDEFYITSEWEPALKPIHEIADKLRGWINLDPLVGIDRHDEALANLLA